MDRTYLQWTLPNWITVFLMTSVGFLAIGAIIAAGKTVAGNG